MHLSLYGFDACPYCQRVYRALEALDVELERRDVHAEPAHQQELLEAMGRNTVPVLRIEEDGDVRWLAESRDIVVWLYERYGEGKKPPPTLGLHRATTFAMWGMLVLGMFFPEHQMPLWMAALTLGAIRSIANAMRTRSWIHTGIAGVFIFGVVAVGLQFAGIMLIPWWYAAYGLVAMLLVATVVMRLRARRPKSP